MSGVDTEKLEKKPILYMLGGAIPLIGGLALYINSLKDATIEKLEKDLVTCKGENKDKTDDYMDLFKECNE